MSDQHNTDFDGLCGVPLPIPIRGGLYLWCKYEMSHAGPHSWHKHQEAFFIGSHTPIGGKQRFTVPGESSVPEDKKEFK